MHLDGFGFEIKESEDTGNVYLIREVISKGATSVLEPSTEPWGQRTCYIADPEGNLIEIGSWNKPFRSWSDKDMQFIKLSPTLERKGIKNV